VNKKAAPFLILVALAAVLLVVVLVKLLSGAVTIVSGAFNTVLGIVVILALVFIVAWMFSYARRSGKK
jgi:hypothetical protein